ncbi:hypothetical protein Q5752_000286 [Cryptotrichosporon argae]
MLDLATIVGTALKEHAYAAAYSRSRVPDAAALVASVEAQLADPSAVPAYSAASAPLTLVRFRCLLQDTGYPAEVYLPAGEDETGETDWAKLKERWVGWGVEIPGEQAWARGEHADDVSAALGKLDLDREPSAASAAVRAKWPLPEGRETYLGALVKVYDDVSFRPASAYTMLGLLSSAALPSPIDGDSEDTADLVPCIHVVAVPQVAYPAPAPAPPTRPAENAAAPVDDDVRAQLIGTLAAAFDPPDHTAATLLLLVLLSSPSVRPPALAPLGTLSLNLLRPALASAPSASLVSLLSALTPLVVPLPLSLALLHAHPFVPTATDAALAAGLLQLAPGTLVVVDEDHMGAGGQLDDAALRNLRALAETIEFQRTPYRYPYMDDLKMDAAVRALVVSEGKSILPMDVHLPVTLAATAPAPPAPQLAAYRSYLATHASPSHAAALVIPESTAMRIEDAFVAARQADGDGGLERAEATLRRRMRVARLVALSRGGELDAHAWEETVRLDEEIERRLRDREDRRRGSPIGQPAAQAASA